MQRVRNKHSKLARLTCTCHSSTHKSAWIMHREMLSGRKKEGRKDGRKEGRKEGVREEASKGRREGGRVGISKPSIFNMCIQEMCFLVYKFTYLTL